MLSPGRGNLYMLLVMVCQLVVSVLFSFAGGLSFFENVYLAQILYQVFSLFVPFVFFLAITRIPVADILPTKPLSLTNAGLIILLCIAVQPVMMFLSGISSLFFPNNIQAAMAEFYSGSIFFVFITVSVFPSLLEEITLRGVVLSNYRQIPIQKAALFNGLFFGIMHFDLQQFCYAFVLGVMFAYFVYYTRSILSSILAHFTINSIQSGLAYFTYQSEPAAATATYTTSELISTLAYMGIISILFLPTLVIVFRFFINHNQTVNLREAIRSEDMPDASYHQPPTQAKITTISFWLTILGFAVFSVGAIVSQLT